MLNFISFVMLAISSICPACIIMAFLIGARGDVGVALMLLASCVVSLVLAWWIMRSANDLLEKIPVRPVSVKLAGMGPIPLLGMAPLLIHILHGSPWLVMASAVAVVAIVMRRPDFNLTLDFLGWSVYDVFMEDGREYHLVMREGNAINLCTPLVGRVSPNFLMRMSDEKS